MTRSNQSLSVAFIGLRGVPAAYGGIERAIEEIGCRLVAHGHTVTVYCMANQYAKSERAKWYKGMRLIYVPTLRSKNLEMIIYAVLASLIALFRSSDIVHYHALGPSTFAFLPRLLGKKVVCTVHGLDWQREKWGTAARIYLKLGEWSTAHMPHRTVVVSQTLRDYYERRYKLSTRYIPNGVADARLLQLDEAGAEYGLRRRNYVLFVGRLTAEKNVHSLIEAYRDVRTDMKLVIVGGSSHTDDYVEKLRDCARGDERVILTGQIYDAKLLGQLYSNAYLFVLPSLLEGLPVVLLEALSYGNAALVSDIPENLEAITSDEGRHGFVFELHNPLSLTNTLQDLVTDEAAVAAMRQSSAEFVLAKYNWDAVTAQTESVYHEVLAH